MQNRRPTKSYEGRYTDSKGKKSNLKIKIFSGFGALVMFITLVKGTGEVIHIITNNAKPQTEDANPAQNSDLALIDKILAENPDRLKIVTPGVHKIEVGNSLGYIAQEHGITIKDILEMNPELESSKTIIQIGQELKIKTVTRLEGVDEKIKIYESYFYDYVLHSEVADIANKSGEDRVPQSDLFRSLLYGESQDGVIDQNSFQGRYISAYTSFHDREDKGEITDAEKEAYLDTLEGINEDLAANNVILGLIPFEQYEIYCKNGNTKNDELVEHHRTVYD